MTAAEGFGSAVRNATSTDSNRGRLPGELLAEWERMIQFCEEGYDDTIDEYHNDLAVRDVIESVLASKQLQVHEELAWFREQVAALDERFRALVQPDLVVGQPGTAWWHRHPPRWAGPELAADFQSLHGVTVAPPRT
jgi:hypothetical protein